MASNCPVWRLSGQIFLVVLSLFGLLVSPPLALAVQTAGDIPKLEWHPKVGESFKIQLNGNLDTKVPTNIYDIDLFDTTATQIAFLKKANRKAVCYFSAGSSENWRPDFQNFSKKDMGKPLQGWQGENWLDIRSSNVRRIMRARMDLAVRKGCDGIDPDNVDGYSNSTGFDLTAKEQLSYNLFLAHQAHVRGLAVGLKNDIAQIGVLAPSFEFAVNEQCHEFNECAGYRAFTTLGKPVLNIEYQALYVKNTDGARVALCEASRLEEMYTLVLPLSLMGTSRISCDGK